MALLSAGVPRDGKRASMVLRTSGSDLRRWGEVRLPGERIQECGEQGRV